MIYQEYQPAAYLSKHIECYWELELLPGEMGRQFITFSPDCTFEILFSECPLFFKRVNTHDIEEVSKGAVFVGQKTCCVKLVIDQSTKIFGVRFKPFAFANVIQRPLHLLNDKILLLEKIFSLNAQDHKSMKAISSTIPISDKIELVEFLLRRLLKKSFSVDQVFRAQINYILDRKGIVKITDLFSTFGVTKATLRKHFINKMGLSPKKVSRIWRVNYFLHLQKSMPSKNLTELGIASGYYDQAHFTKEFRCFFGDCPSRFFRNKNQLMGISQETISRRFTNQYDPR